MDVIEQLRSDIKLSRRKRDEFVNIWQLNVDARRGKGFDTAGDEGRSMVPVDWTITKSKAAQLFSQMPQVRLTPKHEAFAQAVPVFAKIVNDLMTAANTEAVVSEAVVDCINASGIGACVVRYEALTDMVPVAAVDTAIMPPPPSPEAGAAPSTLAPDATADPTAGPDATMTPEDASGGSGAPPAAPATLPMQSVQRTLDARFVVDRISPSDLLWPTRFRLSDWNKSPWLGHTQRAPWPHAKRLLNLRDEDKDKVVGASQNRNVTLANKSATEAQTTEEIVEWDEVFYWRYLYDETAPSYDAIQRVVFVQGLDEPQVDEPWKGQEFDAQSGDYVGSCLLPIRVLTLHYISDEAIPPSDSAIIRPQIKELQEGREHMRQQRKHSRPLRWFNVDLVDPTMTHDLIAGTWQGMIPVQGTGDRAMGEIARSTYPAENMEFDRQLKNDIQEAVGVGPNQSASYASGERSASEAQIVQANFQTEIGQQRARVAAFFVSIAEVLAGLWCLYGKIEPTGIGASIGPDGEQRLQQWDRQRINQKFVFDVRADSTVRLDAQQLIQQLQSALNMTAQSGFINPKPVIAKIFELNGIDPAEVMVDPTPKGPEPPKIVYTFKGEDLQNPIVLAVINKTGQGPGPQDVQAAQQELQSLMQPPQPPGVPGAVPGGVGAPPMPPAGPGPGPGGQMALPMPGPSGPGAPPVPHNPEIPGEGTLPGWEASPRIITRRSE